MSVKKSLKKRINDGEIVFGTFYKTNSPIVVELIGYAGFDFIIVDCEHSSISHESVENIIRTGEGVGLPAIVRVPCARDEHIFHALDSGAAGVQLPNLTSVEEMEISVKNAKYFPQGNRGLSRNQRAAKFGFWTEEISYVEYANNNTVVSVHIESKEMVEHIEEICQMPQIDVVFVGPADLSQSMGIPGQSSDPRVVEAAKRVFETAKKYQKAGGIYVGNTAGMEKYIALGATYIVYGSDTTIFKGALKTAVESFLPYKNRS
jgi:4-hydroxy-2-oxoheptanedioate aldolase